MEKFFKIKITIYLDLIKMLKESRYLTEKEAEIALEWSKNPEVWG